MKELIERLRYPVLCTLDDRLEAADALERLTAEIDNIKQVEFPRRLKNVASAWKGKVDALTAERDALQKNLIVAEGARDALHIFNDQLISENAALRADAELKYIAWQSPHNDDLWLENPADCEIIDNFHPPVHVGFEYELTAGSYTTQRYRVVKIADAESDDVLVELIAGEKT